eukprot:COSAG05_NODE_3804_length_1830_cov_1.870595_1_plen_194_part_00
MTESLTQKLQDVSAASEYLSRSMKDLGRLALDQIRKLEQEKDAAVTAERETMKATLELSKELRTANEDYVKAEQTHATEMAKTRASPMAKRKRTAETGTSTDSPPVQRRKDSLETAALLAKLPVVSTGQEREMTTTTTKAGRMVDKGVAATTGELPRGPKGRLAYDVKPHQRRAGKKRRQTAEGDGDAAVNTN